MALLKWARVWIDLEGVATVAKLYFAKTVLCSAIVDKDVVRFDVCRSIKRGARTHLSYLHNTCMDITTAMEGF